MTGNAQDPGVMMRSIDVIFNSIADHLVSRKNMIVPDRLNDFQVRCFLLRLMQQQQMGLVIKLRKVNDFHFHVKKLGSIHS